MSTANQRLKEGWSACLMGSALASLAVHWALVAIVPPWHFPLEVLSEPATTFVQLIPINATFESVESEPAPREEPTPVVVVPEFREPEEWNDPLPEWVPVMVGGVNRPAVPHLEPTAVSVQPSLVRSTLDQLISPIAWPQIANPERMNGYIRSRYNPILTADGTKGMVILTLWVDERGDVKGVRLTESSGTDSLDDIAVRAFEQVVTFIPARHEGRALAVQFNLSVPFFTAW